MNTLINDRIRTNNVLKIVSILCFIFFIYALITLRSYSSKGYEPSIYVMTPSIFWISISANVICGTSIILYQVYNRAFIKNNFWIIGFLLICISFISLVSLWIIRGYINWGNGDPLTHVGLTNYIISYNHFDINNYYPIIHILTAEMSYILNFQVIDISKYIATFFNIIYLIFIICLAKAVLSSKMAITGAIILTAVTCIVFFNSNISFAPNTLANLYLPFAIYLFIKSSSPGTFSWKILFFLVIILYPPFHPVPTLALLIIIGAVTIPNIVISIIKNRDFKSMQGVFTFRLPVFLFLLVWAVTWFSHFNIWQGMLINSQAYFTNIGITQIMVLNQQIQYAQQYNYNIVFQFFKIYGEFAVIILIALATLPSILKEVSFKIENKNLLSLYGPLTILAFSIVIFYLMNLAFSPLRLLVYIALICSILAAFSLNKILMYPLLKPNKTLYQYLYCGLVFLIIVGAFSSSTLQLYPSRYTLQPNDQVTKTNLAGMDWFFYNRNQTYQFSSIYLQPDVYADYLLSPKVRSEQSNLFRVMLDEKEGIVMPWHFGYEKYDELGEWYNQKSYLVICQLDRVIYQKVYPEMQNIRFTSEDFDRLDLDPSITKLYSDSGIEVYDVVPLSGQ